MVYLCFYQFVKLSFLSVRWQKMALLVFLALARVSEKTKCAIYERVYYFLFGVRELRLCGGIKIQNILCGG